MSRKRIASILLIVALSFSFVLPAAAAGDQAEASWSDIVVELVEQIVDFFTPEAPEGETADDEGEDLPSVIPVIDPNG